jgi:hypothetical protein
MRWTKLDGAIAGFDRASGTNLLYASPATAALGRDAPRSLQIGLLTPCNLACGFCYRDREAPSRLDKPFLVDLLQRADRWGVLEVAFGGGEPLLFKGFAELVEELHATTQLGLNVTTNGMLLTRELVDRLRGKIGEYRLSIYPDNDWRGTLDRVDASTAGSIGVNWLVTPANIDDVAPRVREFIALGARNVLLLGYKGADRTLLLDDAHLAAFRSALVELEGDGAPILLDICWHPQLADLPHLFPRTDCGAGDDILAITADRAVQACSFADRRIPFESFEQLQLLYRLLRAARPHANVGGCTRDLFTISTKPASPSTKPIVSGRILPVDTDTPALFAWQGRASSNSGAYTILARFKTEDAARLFEQELDTMYQAHLDFMVEDSDRATEYYQKPTPPLTELAKRYGFEWPADNGFAWEGDSFGDRAEADQLQIERFGQNVIVYLPYGQEIGDRGLAKLAEKLGAASFGFNPAFRVVVRPSDKPAQTKVKELVDPLESEYLVFDSRRTEDDEFDDAVLDPVLGEDVGEQPFDECEYRVEVVLPETTIQLGFASTIGGLGDVAKLVIDLAAIKNVGFELEIVKSEE